MDTQFELILEFQVFKQTFSSFGNFILNVSLDLKKV
jgi:hypothetical protein